LHTGTVREKRERCNEEVEETGVLDREGGEGECAGASGEPPPEKVLPDPKQKAAAKPKHKETMQDLIEKSDE